MQEETTFYIVIPFVNNPNRAIYTLVQDKNTLQSAFNVLDTYLRSAVDLVGSGRPVGNDYNIKPGIVEKIGNNWKISTKGLLSW